jgi:hypothetical protein
MVSFRKCCFVVDLKIAGIVISILLISGSIYLIKHNVDEISRLPEKNSGE